MQIDNKMKMLSLEKNNWHGLTITNAGARQIRRLLDTDTSMLGIRINVKESGCAGFGYIMNKVTVLEETDLVYEHNGVRLFVPLKAMPLIDGTELDYVQEGLNYIFKFNNPKAQHACGCGESFGL